MNVSDWQHTYNTETARLLTLAGYEFKVTSDGYDVRYNGEFLGGAMVNPDTAFYTRKRKHYRICKADMRENLQTALTIARFHQAKTKTELLTA